MKNFFKIFVDCGVARDRSPAAKGKGRFGKEYSAQTISRFARQTPRIVEILLGFAVKNLEHILDEGSICFFLDKSYNSLLLYRASIKKTYIKKLRAELLGDTQGFRFKNRLVE